MMAEQELSQLLNQLQEKETDIRVLKEKIKELGGMELITNKRN